MFLINKNLKFTFAIIALAAALSGCNSSNGGVLLTPLTPTTPPGGGGRARALVTWPSVLQRQAT